MADYTKDLEEGIKADIAGVKQKVDASKEARVMNMDEEEKPTSFGPTALRIKGKIVGQTELANLNSRFKEVLDHYMKTASFVDDAERMQRQRDLEQRFRGFQLDMMKKGLQFNADLEKQGLDLQRKQASIAAFSKALSGITAAAVGYGSKDGQKPTAQDAHNSYNASYTPGTMTDKQTQFNVGPNGLKAE